MGIRYSAISIDQEDYERIAAGPCPTCGAHPRRREPENDDEYWMGPDRLDLDKSWHYLQDVLHSPDPRPAYSLVAGDVTHTSRGWISYEGLIAPGDLRLVAADLASVGRDEVLRNFQINGQWKDDRSEQDFHYTYDHLGHAVAFTKKVAEDGRAILYWIG
jgi:hypothetical protein